MSALALRPLALCCLAVTTAAACLPRSRATGEPVALGPSDVDAPVGAEIEPDAGAYGALPATAAADGGLDPMPMPDFRPLYFAFDTFAVGPEARATLDDLAAYLQQHPHAAVTVAGHCDERGTAEYNLALGERRALAARSYLAGRGVAEDRVRVVSYGSERPAQVGQGESIWAQNRRDELQVATAAP